MIWCGGWPFCWGKHPRFAGTNWSLATAAILDTHDLWSRGISLQIYWVSGVFTNTQAHLIKVLMHQEYYIASSIRDLFTNAKQVEIFVFLRTISRVVFPQNNLLKVIKFLLTKLDHWIWSHLVFLLSFYLHYMCYLFYIPKSEGHDGTKVENLLLWTWPFRLVEQKSTSQSIIIFYTVMISCDKEATVIPIPKPGKASNYRPIVLTSCICKTMEHTVNNHLVWLLESGHHISNFQCGFRQGRSTLNHLVRMETFIRDAFLKKELTVAVFFDIEKAYDTTWQHSIMKDLHAIGLRGHLPIFIRIFLALRHFRIRVKTTYSSLHS